MLRLFSINHSLFFIYLIIAYSMKKILTLSILVVLGNKNLSAQSLQSPKTEELEYVSAIFDPASEETQIHFVNASNGKRIFYYNKQDSLKLEESFFNKPAYPINTNNLNLTKTELVGKKYKVQYYALTETSTSECCFKIKKADEVK